VVNASYIVSFINAMIVRLSNYLAHLTIVIINDDIVINSYSFIFIAQRKFKILMSRNNPVTELELDVERV